MTKQLLIIILVVMIISGLAQAATYYVKQNGNDNANGLSWANAWSTLNKVNGSVGRGDTVFFGTGIWRGELKLKPGYVNDRTVYACSAFALANGAGQYHFAKIYGSQRINNWVQHSGNVYKAYYTASDGGLLCQGDSLFWLQSGLSGVNQSGRFYITGDTIYAYVYNLGAGYDPDNYQMEAAAAPIIHVRAGQNHTESADYVTLWGLEFKYAAIQTIRMETPHPTHFYIDHCKLSHIASLDFTLNNPACIYSGNQIGQEGTYNRALACSIGYAICHDATNTHGCGITLYSQDHFVVDSCVFFGYFTADCVQYKGYNDYGVVRYSYFNPTAADNAIKLYADTHNDSVYGNIIVGNNISNGAVYFPYTGATTQSQTAYVFNNTILQTAGIPNHPTCNGETPFLDKHFKYNIIYLSNGHYAQSLMDCDLGCTVIDSNLYCLGSSTFRIAGAVINLLNWRDTYHFDQRSVFVTSLNQIGFADYNNGDYSRPGSPQEMNRTYAGRTWTRYGAWQTPSAPDTTPPIISGIGTINTTFNSAQIVWNTNEPANSTVNFGFSTTYGQVATDASYTYSHQISLSNLQPDTTYHYRVISRDPSGNESVSGDYTFRTDTVTTYQNLALGITPTVSSTYNGYTITPINNGVIAPRGGTATTWASTSNLTIPHWIEFDFGSAKQLSSVRIYWAWNSTSSSWMCSRQYHLQYWNAATSSFENITTVNNTAAESVTVTTFAPRVTTRFRYYQPAGMGPATYPSVVWLTELEIYGNAAPTDTIPPAPVRNLEGRPGSDRGSIDLFWSATGDDDTIGQASAYLIRYMPDTGLAFDWEQAIEISEAPAPESSGISQSLTIGGLDEGRIYMVAIRAADEMGNISPIGEIVDTFACGIAPPTPLHTEVDSTTGSVMLVSSLVDSYMPLYYEFALDSLAGFASPQIRQDLVVDSLPTVIYTGLSPGKIYFWRSRAKSNGAPDSSSWSQTVSFSLEEGPIAPPLLTQENCIYPGSGETVVSSRPTFLVNIPQEAFEVYIQVDDDELFEQPIESGPLLVGDSANIRWRIQTDLLDQHTYYWRVSSDNSNWSSTVQFSTSFAIHAYPNPFRPALGHSGIYFTSLPENSRITITTISGNPIKAVSSIGPGEWVWDARGDRNEELSAGVYLYSVDYDGGSTGGKIIIIK